MSESLLDALLLSLEQWLSLDLSLEFEIDDAVDTIRVHFFKGMWGCIATALSTAPRHTDLAYGATNCGLFYSNGNLLTNEIIGRLFILAWVGVIMTPFFFALNFFGMFSVDPLEEKVGLDISHHKGAAYDLTRPDKEDVDVLTEKRATVTDSWTTLP